MNGWPLMIGLKMGKSGAATISAWARLSRRMKSKSLLVSKVLTAMGTRPALIAPRKTAGKSMVSSSATMTRDSMGKPSPVSALAARFTRCASSAKL